MPVCTNKANVRQDKLGKEDVHGYVLNGNLCDAQRVQLPRGKGSPSAASESCVVRSDAAAKRRQPVLTPCDGAPKLFVAGAFVVLAAGATPKYRVGGVQRSDRGQRAGHTHRRGIPGTCENPLFPVRVGPKAPDRRSKSQAAGSVLVPDRAKTRAEAGTEWRIHKSLGRGTGKS
jgi:hypothetical protein